MVRSSLFLSLVPLSFSLTEIRSNTINLISVVILIRNYYFMCPTRLCVACILSNIQRCIFPSYVVFISLRPSATATVQLPRDPLGVEIIHQKVIWPRLQSKR